MSDFVGSFGEGVDVGDATVEGTAAALRPDPSAPPRRLLDACDARRVLADALAAFVEAAVTSLQGEAPCPALACRVTAGTGKTTQTLRAIAGRAAALLEHGSVLVFVPGHAHASEALAVFEALAPGVPAVALRGRSALYPADGEPMCRRAEEAQEIGRLGASVRSALCEARDCDGEIRWAPCRHGCRYFQQFEAQMPRVVFLAHAYLGNEPGDLGPVAMRVIDEAFYGTLSYSRSLDLLGWIDAPGPTPADLVCTPTLADIDRARMAVFSALRAEASPTAALRAHGVDQAALEAFVAFEEQSAVSVLGIRPWQPDAERKRRHKAIDRKALHAARARARIWRILRNAIGRETTERLKLRRPWQTAGTPSSPVIAFHVRRDLPLDAPLLMLDAEADPLITRVFAPRARFLRIDARPEAEVIQISDRTLSQKWLLDPARGLERRCEVSRIIAQETARATGGVMLVATQAVLEALHRDHDPAFPTADQAALARPLLGATPRWFGPNLRGIDAFRAFETIIILGRLEPAIADIEDAMRAIFGDADGDDPLVFLPRVDGRIAAVHMRETTRLMDDGAEVAARLSSHPDPRGHALLAQIREGTTNQAIARLRLVSPDRPKRVVVLCSVPLPDLPVARLVTWNGITCRRLHDAIVNAEGDLRVTEVGLSATGLAMDLPMAFTSIDVAKAWRRGRTTADVEAACRTIAASAGATVAFVTRRGRGKAGLATPTAIFTKHGEGGEQSP